MIPFRFHPGSPDGASVLVIADHASNAVPPGVHLGVPLRVMLDHVAVDIGAGPVALALGQALGAGVFLANASRLVVDLNREPDSPGLVPQHSDGIAIPGNHSLSAGQMARRLAWHRDYHETLAATIARLQPRMLVSVHSFTPSLASRPQEARPWPIGILYNHDARLATSALAWLNSRDINAGDNQPYSGRDLNYTMNRHAEATGLPYLGIELRQDQVGDPGGVGIWAAILAALVSDLGNDIV